MGLGAMILVFWMLSFKPTFLLSSFTFIKWLFSYSSLSAIRVVSSAYLRLLIFLPAILIQLLLPPAQLFSWYTLHISLTIAISAIMHLFVYVSLWTSAFTFSGYITMSVITWSYGILFLMFWGILKNIYFFHHGSPNLYFHQQFMIVPFSQHSH